MLFFVVWLAQALDAYRRALRAGGVPGGELWVAVVLPVAILVLTAFWLVGGRQGSPSATLQAYVEAWTTNRPEAAAPLFELELAPDEMRAQWSAQNADLTQRVAAARALYGADSGLDTGRPFSNLRFREVATVDGQAEMVVEIVRRQRVQTTLLGIVPTAAQQTVAVERALTIRLSLERALPPDWLAPAQIDSFVWKITSVEPAGTR